MHRGQRTREKKQCSHHPEQRQHRLSTCQPPSVPRFAGARNIAEFELQLKYVSLGRYWPLKHVVIASNRTEGGTNEAFTNVLHGAARSLQAVCDRTLAGL